MKFVSLILLCLVSSAFAADDKSSCNDPLHQAIDLNAKQKHTQHLIQAGFTRVDTSDYFYRGAIFVQVNADGSLTLQTSVSEDLSHPQNSLLRLSRDKNRDELSLYIISPQGILIRSFSPTSNGYSGVPRDQIAEMISQYQSFSGKELLLQAGFVQDAKHPSLYTLKLNYHPEPMIITAVLDGNGAIAQIVRPSGSLQKLLLNKNVQVVGFRPYSNKRNAGLSAIRFSNGFMEFEISEEGFVRGSQTITKDLADIADQDLKLTLAQNPASKKRDKWIGGMNVSAWLREPSVADYSNVTPKKRNLKRLQEDLKPGHSSQAGFLGENESFDEVLKQDQQTVEKMGLTHQQLAYPLLKILAARMQGFPKTFTYMGYRYKWEEAGWRGYQESPFLDGEKTSFDFTITNLDTSKTIKFSGLVPQLIHRYGFYEGKRTPYRVNPEDIVSVFPFLTDGKRNTEASRGLPEKGLEPSASDKMAMLRGVQLQVGKRAVHVTAMSGFDTNDLGPWFIDKVNSFSGDKQMILLNKYADSDRFENALAAHGRFSYNINLTKRNTTLLIDNLDLRLGPATEKPITQLRIDLGNLVIPPAYFDLERLTQSPHDRAELERLAGYLNAIYGLPSTGASAAIGYIHIYSESTSETRYALLSKAEAREGQLILNALFLADTKAAIQEPGSAKIEGKIARVIPHEKYTEIIMDLNRPGWQAAFNIPLGNGVFSD